MALFHPGLNIRRAGTVLVLDRLIGALKHTAVQPRPVPRPSVRYLGLLLLLTPLLGGLNLLARQATAPTEVVREVVEVPQPVFVPQTVYVTVEVPTVVVVEVPTDSTAVALQPAGAGPALADPPGDAEVATETEPEAEEPAAEEPAPEQSVLARRPVYRPVVSWSPPPEPIEEPEPEPTPPPVAAEPVVEPPAEAPPDPGDGPTLAARQALADFYAYTERTWSVKGYSSAAEMRAALGNSQSNWLEDTQAAAAGEKPAPPAPGDKPEAAPGNGSGPILPGGR